MVKYAAEAEFDYHSLNYGENMLHTRKWQNIDQLLLLLLSQLLSSMLKELALS